MKGAFNMRKYKITFEVKAPNGWWHDDDLTNNGKGFTYEEAKCIAADMRIPAENGIQLCNVRVVEI
jgi:hypothetical protein